MTPEKFRETISAFQRSRVILTAFELDIFSRLDGGPLSSSDTAALIHANARGTDRLMNALVNLGLLEKKDGKFSNTPFSADFLVKGKPSYLAGTGHTIGQWFSWSTLTDAVRKGTTTCERPADINDRGDHWLESFIAAMHQRGKATAPVIVSKLDFSRVNRVLDIGGGSGVFVMEMATAKQGLTGTVLDLPNVVGLAKKYIETASMSDRIGTIAADYHEGKLPGGYDMVFLSAIIHINNPEENGRLIANCAGALNPGGQIVISDFIMDDDRTSPPEGAFFALNMLTGTECGDTYTGAEVRDWFAQCGIAFQKLIPMIGGTSIIIGVKD